MFAPKTSAPSAGGLSINTNSANSLFGGASNTNTTSTAASGTTGTAGATGGLFGGANTTTPKPAGGLFGGGSTTQNTGSSMFSGLGGQQQQSGSTGGGLFGSTPSTGATAQSGTTGGGLFGSTAGAGAATGTTQSGGTGGGLFGGLGASTAQTQPKPAFGGLGSSTTGGGLFGGGQSTQQPQQQQQQPQQPTLSLFGNNPGQNASQPLQQNTANNVVPGVKVDTSNLLPTTKFDSCTDELRNQIEFIDNYILAQMKMSHEVADMLPTIEQQGASIPNDVDFVQNKLETLQHALENDAGDIDGLRNIVSRDAAEAQVAFRAIDTLKLPLQYQSSGGGWWGVQDQKVPERRSTRKNTLALPDDVDGDPSTATEVNGVPVNLVDYFSLRSNEMGSVLDRYKGNLKEIEDHLYGVEMTLNRQINEFVSSRSRDGAGHAAPKSIINDLAAVLGDVEAGIMGVAARLGGVSEQAQEVTLGPLSMGEGRLG